VTIEPPRTLDDLRSVSDLVTRAKAARAYVEQRQQAITTALTIRDAAIRELLKTHRPAEVARMCEVSVSTVKLARGRS
jgi:hypothetical protein